MVFSNRDLKITAPYVWSPHHTQLPVPHPHHPQTGVQQLTSPSSSTISDSEPESTSGQSTVSMVSDRQLYPCIPIRYIETFLKEVTQTTTSQGDEQPFHSTPNIRVRSRRRYGHYIVHCTL